MTSCHLTASGQVELFFYDEFDDEARAHMQQHLAGCVECRRALEDLGVIRDALAARPDVAAPEGGDWTRFMSRLELAVQAPVAGAHVSHVARSAGQRRHSLVVYVAMAALLSLVTMSVAYVFRTTGSPGPTAPAGSSAAIDPALPATPAPEAVPASAGGDRAGNSAFAALSEQHFERSKLVVLGLASKDPRRAMAADWAYERQLASTLLSDTRLYRLAAEERGLKNIARVMGDLELVLLQTSVDEQPDPSTLEQIQRLIAKRDLVTRMDVVATVAGL